MSEPFYDEEMDLERALFPWLEDGSMEDYEEYHNHHDDALIDELDPADAEDSDFED